MKRALLPSIPQPLICLLFLCLMYNGPASAQMINGDAETGDLQGWTASSAMVASVTQLNQSSGLVLPAEGDHFFSLAQQPGSSASLTQTGNLATGQHCLRLFGQFQCLLPRVHAAVRPVDPGAAYRQPSGALRAETRPRAFHCGNGRGLPDQAASLQRP